MSLDAHGNPVALEDVDGHNDVGAYVELHQTDGTDTSMLRAGSEAVSQIHLPRIPKSSVDETMIFRIRNQHTQINNYYFLLRTRGRRTRRNIGAYDLPKLDGITKPKGRP